MTESERERQREMLHEGLVDTVTRRIKRPDAHVAVGETVFELSRRHNDGDIHMKRFMDLLTSGRRRSRRCGKRPRDSGPIGDAGRVRVEGMMATA